MVVTRTTRNRFVLNRARGFESHHLRQQKAPAQAGAFCCGKDGEDENRAAVRRPQAISPVQRRRPLPVAETGRSCWGSVLIFQSLPRGCGKISKRNPLLLLSPRENIHHLRQQKAPAQAGAFLHIQPDFSILQKICINDFCSESSQAYPQT